MMPLSLPGKVSVSLIVQTLELLLLIGGGTGYPGGAPDLACLSMIPTGHQAEPQHSDSPYNVFVSKKSYKPGETLQVVVQSDGEDYFRGLFLQARMTGCNVNETKTVGVFTNTDSELETKHCFGNVHSAVSHNSARKKRLKTFYWTAPVVSSGHVVMRATIVRQLQEFWIGVESEIVVDLHAQVTTKCIPTLQPPIPALTGPSFFVETAENSNLSRTLVVTAKLSSDDTTAAGISTPSPEKNLPSWLNSDFESVSTPKEPADNQGSSWLIPAYHRGANSASPSVSLVTVSGLCYGSVLKASAVGVLFMLM